MRGDLLLAIPVFNEEGYAQSVLEEARPFAENILVIDDGSTDRTPEILRREPGIDVITHAENRGYGKSLDDAFCYAWRKGFDWLITMDCDEQHEAAQIPRFLDAIERDDADIISGTRYPGGFDTDHAAPQDRRDINRRITQLLNERLGTSLTDAFCGFKAYRVSALEHINISVPGYAMPMQFWVQAVRGNLRISELPVPLIYNDPTRHFGGMLDDPEARLAHYLDVFEKELDAAPVAERAPARATRCR